MLLLLVVFAPLAAAVLTSGIWVPLLVWRRQRQTRRRFEALAAELGAVNEGGKLVVPAFAHGCAVGLQPGTRGKPSVLDVTLRDGGAVPGASPMILLRREGRLDRLGKRLWLNREVQVGEPDFDRAVYIESSAPDEVVRSVLGDPTRRRAVLDVLGAGFAQVRILGPGSVVSASWPTPATLPLDSAVVREVARCLAVIAPAVPRREPPADAVPLGATGVLRVVGTIVLVLAAVAGFAGAPGLTMTLGKAYPTLTSDLQHVALAVAGGLFLLALPVVGLAVRGRSESLRYFVLVAVLLLYLLPFYTVSAFLGINAAFDGSASARRASRVMDRWITRGKGSALHVRLAGLQRGDDPIEMEIDADTYAKLEPNAAVVVTTGEGALGWEWIRGIDRDPSDRAR